MNSYWLGLALVLGILVVCVLILMSPSKRTVSYETYEQHGYQDGRTGVPIELCEYVGVDRQWYLRGYKRGWKEIND